MESDRLGAARAEQTREGPGLVALVSPAAQRPRAQLPMLQECL
jgi:hypothetical protein